MNDKIIETEKTCKVHGLCRHVLDSKGKYYRCAKCRVVAVQKRRDTLKLKAVEYKGGKCEVCGYCKYAGALEFHHLDPAQKDFGISHKGFTRSWESMTLELDKCMMLCANCHREIHGKIE